MGGGGFYALSQTRRTHFQFSIPCDESGERDEMGSERLFLHGRRISASVCGDK